MNTSLDIVIVNWNSGTQLSRCIESISKTLKEGFDLCQVIVVDNASTDNSLNLIQPGELPIKIIHNRNNEGFARGCNQGAAAATSDYILFLNPDSFLYPDSLSTPIRFMEQPSSSQHGICGIQLLDQERNVTPTCAHFPSLSAYIVKILGLNRILPGIFQTQLMTDWDHQSSRVVDQIMGAYLLVRSESFRLLNGFDERFFVYLEEVDLSKRMLEMGYTSYYLSDAQAYHKGCGTSDQVHAIRLSYNLRSRLLYAAKHFSNTQTTILTFFTLAVEPLTRMTHATLNLSFVELSEVMSGYFMTYRKIPSLFWQMTQMKTR